VADAYVTRDTCELPPLIRGMDVLDAGATFTCIHGFVYGIRHIAFNGGTTQPAWVRQIDPPRVVQQATVQTPPIAKGATATVVVTWDEPMPSAVYAISVARATSAQVVQWAITAQTAADVTVAVTALIALPAATVTVLASA
jgi:hypothetical protein